MKTHGKPRNIDLRLLPYVWVRFSKISKQCLAVSDKKGQGAPMALQASRILFFSEFTSILCKATEKNHFSSEIISIFCMAKKGDGPRERRKWKVKRIPGRFYSYGLLRRSISVNFCGPSPRDTENWRATMSFYLLSDFILSSKHSVSEN